MPDLIAEQVISELSLGLDWAAKKQRAIANNLSNVDTPGYKRQEVTFPQALQRATQRQLSLRQTNSRHLPSKVTGAASTVIETNTTHRNDGNNVDIELETTELTRNFLYYNALIDQAGEYFRNLRLVISEGRR
ncbi:MAG: flagellar basal body rod protein FlgB [Firmicutes bacterium]|nr:flagellar basal body rod protein FlgB [Bacillota bacterium]